MGIVTIHRVKTSTEVFILYKNIQVHIPLTARAIIPSCTKCRKKTPLSIHVKIKVGEGKYFYTITKVVMTS